LNLRNIVVASICVAVGLVVSVLFVSATEQSRRTSCAANLHGIYQSMYVFQEGRYFPIAGERSRDAVVLGFREGDRKTDHGAILDNNATASLWMMVRNGYCLPDQFVCPSTDDTADELVMEDGSMALLENTRDFMSASNLSFSMPNMYGMIQRRHWSSNCAADTTLLADDNNNPSGNSLNHRGDGQNILYGDGHVAFSITAFSGPGGESIYADPDFDNEQSALEKSGRRSMLLPVTGNGGGAGSLDPAD
jgi:prepilin-type processing-associated H-X9-DG protein